MAHEIEMAQIDRGILSPQEMVREDHQKYPVYKAGDIEAFLQNFEQLCLDYNIPPEQYMEKL